MSGGAQVTACLVTRGDVDLTPILESLPPEWPVAVWDNAVRDDLKVYGRYALLKEIETPLAYVQDDDCIIKEPEWLVQHYKNCTDIPVDWEDFPLGTPPVVCNMPQEFRHDFYSDHALVGFGAVFHRDAPKRAFKRFYDADIEGVSRRGIEQFGQRYVLPAWMPEWAGIGQFFARTCDVVFTALTPRVLVDVPKENLPWATDDTRMYRQPEHVGERATMLELVRQVKGAA